MDPTTEPSTESNDREARIRARRLRVEQRNASKIDESQKKNTQVAKARQLTRGQQQIAESLDQLDKQKLKGIESVTSIRVEADNTENIRRINEEDTRRSRLQKLQEESISSGKQNAAVELRWSELLDYSMPQELFKEITAQKDACLKIMSSKDDLIKECQNQLKLKDEEYVRALKHQSEDVETLINRMGAQLKSMQQEYATELEQIEDAFLRERDELLASNKSEIDALFEKRRAMEMMYMESKQARDEQYQKEIEDLRLKDAEDYNKLKIKLETDIQTLEQQLEEMRATYQLNTEKLEYNYRVLTERDMENSATLSQQKRKLTRLKDTLSTLMQKYTQTDARDRHQNQELTEEYRRITKQYKDLQNKFHHFELADNRKYEEVWKMHEAEMSKLASKILKADRIIHEQQLGLNWLTPAQHPSKLTRGRISTMNKEDSARPADNAVEKEEVREADTTTAEAQSLPKISGSKLKLMLEMLSSEAGFLIDPKVKQAIDTLDENEADLVRADSILNALGVENEADMEKLTSYFFENIGDAEVDPSAANLAQELGLKITPDNVIAVIQSFVTEMDEARANESESQVVKHALTVKEGIAEAEESRRNRIRQEEREYWRRIVDVIPARTLRVWSALEKGLIEYNNILEQRSKTINDVHQVQAQNSELKALLRQYLGDSVNENLIIPPTQVIRVQGQPT